LDVSVKLIYTVKLIYNYEALTPTWTPDTRKNMKK